MVHITHNISTAIEKSNKTKRKSFKMKININNAAEGYCI